LEEGLYVYLKNVSGLSALIADRIYPSLGAQMPTLPAIVFERISTPSQQTMDGASLFSPRVQISVLATTALSAIAVADQIRPSLNAFQGQWSDGTYVQLSSLLDERGPFFDYETNSYVSQLDFEIWHT
jgi:Protein of unknown function (DUF3168)